MNNQLTAEQHLDRALRNAQYIRAWVTGNEEVISAENTIKHIREAQKLLKSQFVIEQRPRRSERPSRFSTGRS